jgi:hypothetical protein
MFGSDGGFPPDALAMAAAQHGMPVALALPPADPYVDLGGVLVVGAQLDVRELRPERERAASRRREPTTARLEVVLDDHGTRKDAAELVVGEGAVDLAGDLLLLELLERLLALDDGRQDLLAGDWREVEARGEDALCACVPHTPSEERGGMGVRSRSIRRGRCGRGAPYQSPSALSP